MEKTPVKAFRVLERLAQASQPMGVTELAAELGLTKSNVHRLLSTLTGLGYVRHSPENGRYEVSLKIWELATHVVARLDIKRVAAEPLARLAAETGETVHLSLFDAGEVVYIDKIESTQPVRTVSRIGVRIPAHCVATGKAMLAFQPQDVIEKAFANLQRFTPHTVVDRAALLEQLARVRQKGVAVSLGEWQDQVYGMAAPIRDASGLVIAAIGIAGPATRLGARERHAHAPRIAAAAERISRALGGPATASTGNPAANPHALVLRAAPATANS